MKVFSITVFEDLSEVKQGDEPLFQYYIFSTLEKLTEFKNNHEIKFYLIEQIEVDKPYDDPLIIDQYTYEHDSIIKDSESKQKLEF